MTSVLIIDDHPIVLQGCRRVLLDAGIEAVLEARDVVSGYRLYRRHRPDVVIVDLSLQGNGLGGLPLIQRIKAHDPRTRILVFSMHSDPIIVSRALKAGAAGYILKDTSSKDLLEAFEKAHPASACKPTMQPVAQRVHVKQRKRQQETVGAGDLPGCQQTDRVGRKVIVREHCALRSSGGAGGVDDARGRIAIDYNLRPLIRKRSSITRKVCRIPNRHSA